MLWTQNKYTSTGKYAILFLTIMHHEKNKLLKNNKVPPMQTMQPFMQYIIIYTHLYKIDDNKVLGYIGMCFIILMV